MGEYIDKVKGTANDLVGKAKIAVGEKTDQPDLIAKGATQRVKGQAQKIAGAAKGAMGDKF
jgi:uncharacterized protein YjbJ (UPF0337 family)